MSIQLSSNAFTIMPSKKTTNLVAAAHENDRQENEKSFTKSTIITALQLSIFVGLAFGVALFLSTPALLGLLLGKNSIGNTPEIIAAATRYIQIRAIGMPAAVMIGSAQSASLGMKDVRSPLYVMVAAAFVNLFGDILFVPNKTAWIGGAAGAAWATVFSQASFE